ERTANTGIDVERQGDNIMLNLPDGITFDFGKSALKPQFYGSLNGVAGTLRDYNQTMIEVVGHTDSIGSDAVNNRLSKERADSVAQYLIGQRVQSVRIETLGAGKAYPIADNGTDAGREEPPRGNPRDSVAAINGASAFYCCVASAMTMQRKNAAPTGGIFCRADC